MMHGQRNVKLPDLLKICPCQ